MKVGIREHLHQMAKEAGTSLLARGHARARETAC